MICVISAINGKVIAMRAMYVYMGRKAMCYVTERSVMIYDICVRVNVLCAVNVMGRKAICYGPEGDYVMGRKALCCGPEGQGLERRICVSCILGNSLSIYAYSCYVCVSGTSEDRGKAPA